MNKYKIILILLLGIFTFPAVQAQVKPLADPAVKEAMADWKSAMGKKRMPVLQISLLPVTKNAQESYTLTQRTVKGKSTIIVKAGSLRAVCYALYYLREQAILGLPYLPSGKTLVKNPDFKFRMITQPFEVAGFKPVATLAKPIIRNREFDPMRPFDGAGYAAEAEAKNILRAGLNTFYIGSYTFATTYAALSDTIFPKNSEGLKWVQQRRAKFKELIAAAEKYHLQVCVNSDIFAYPKTVKHQDRYKALSASLNEILTAFPQIDVVIGRFGENYSYFNPYFTGKGPENDIELAGVIDSIYTITVKKYGKVFMPRTWSLGNDSWHADPAHYKKIIKNIKADSNTLFSIKNTQTDFWRYNKFNPALGLGSKKQAIEYLAQDGYHFKSSIPNYEVIRMAGGSKEIDQKPAGMRAARDMGITATWGWLTADGWCGPALKREEWLQANIYGYTQLMWDADQKPEILAQKWAALAFKVSLQSRAAKTLAGILMQSEDMMLKACYFSGYSSEHNGWLPTNNWQRDDVLGGFKKSHKNFDCQFSFGPGTLDVIFNKATVTADCQDKKRAWELASKMLNDYDQIKAALPDQQQATEVRNTLLSGQSLTAVIYHYINGVFRFHNGEKALAKTHLLQWKAEWKNYNENIARLPGAPTPMMNGGMVETCDEILNELAK